MKVKKFEAASMKEALEQIKAEMGPDAFILNTKQLTKKGPLGIGDRKTLVVTAAVDEDIVKSKKAPEARKPEAAAQSQLLDIRQEEEEAWRPGPTAPKESLPKAALYNPRGNTVRPTDVKFDAGALLGGPSPGAALLAGLSSPGANKAGFTSGFEAVFEDARNLIPSKMWEETKDDKRDDSNKDSRGLRTEIQEIKDLVKEMGKEIGRDRPAQTTDLSPLQKELRELKGLLYSAIRTQSPVYDKNLTPAMVQQYLWLKDSGVDEPLAAVLILNADKLLPREEDKNRPDKIRNALFAAMRETIQVAGSKQFESKKLKTIALIGPTGVGKTTTLSKLAAHFTLQRGASVVFITLDTYRIAALEQLKTYAKIMDIPIQVALNLSELRHAIQFHQDKSLILIDTAGHSPTDEVRMEHLSEFLAQQDDIEVHLVLSATTKAADMRAVAKKYERLGPKYLIFTKLDETTSYGSLYSLILNTQIPVSFITTGQSVPEDFEFASREALAALFLGQNLKQVLGAQK